MRIAFVTVAVAMAGAAAAVGGAKTAATFPDVIQLPKGFQPEGIEVGKGTTFYVGSLASGAIWRGNLRTGHGAVFIRGTVGRRAAGIEFAKRKQRLFVAGAATGDAYVFNARNGRLRRAFALGTAPTFINDVVVTRHAAYFTDSSKPMLYKIPIGKRGGLGRPRTVRLSGDYAHVAGAFNLNGIDATRNGKTLIAVQTVNGRLYRINPATGVARTIQLANGESVVNGDGILLNRRTLYVVQNQNSAVAVVRLSPKLRSGKVRRRLTNPALNVPTTIDDFRRRLYAVNARFGIDDPVNADYQVVQLRKRTR